MPIIKRFYFIKSHCLGADKGLLVSCGQKIFNVVQINVRHHRCCCCVKCKSSTGKPCDSLRQPCKIVLLYEIVVVIHTPETSVRAVVHSGGKDCPSKRKRPWLLPDTRHRGIAVSWYLQYMLHLCNWHSEPVSGARHRRVPYNFTSVDFTAASKPTQRETTSLS